MATASEIASFAAMNDRPVIVRVKRKAVQSRLDAFWLEINERPLKRPLLDFGKLSIADSSSSSGGTVEGLKPKKILVQLVETVNSSENTVEVLRSFVSGSSNVCEYKEKHEGKRRVNRKSTIQDELLLKAKHKQKVLSSTARYKQIWKSRKGMKDTSEDEVLQEMCQLYDVVKVDVEEQSKAVKEMNSDLEDLRMISEYLPLLRDVLPEAAVEIEDDIHGSMNKQASSDDYVYDYYTSKYDADESLADSENEYPLIQVDYEDDYYDGPDDSECESDDSNGENNPLNDYPDEISENSDETTSRSSDEESDDDSRTSGNQSHDHDSENDASEHDDSGPLDWSDDEMYSGDIDCYEDDSGENEWR